jgi:hypothetical protein
MVMVKVGDKIRLKSLDTIWDEGNQCVNMCYSCDVDGDIWGMDAETESIASILPPPLEVVVGAEVEVALCIECGNGGAVLVVVKLLAELIVELAVELILEV